MAEQSIRPLIAALDAGHGLARVRRPVDPLRDLAAIGVHARSERGKGVIFEDAAGWRVATQILSDRAQWAAALRVAPGELLAIVQQRSRHGTKPVEVGDAPVAATRHKGEAIALDQLPLPCMGDGDAAGQMVSVAIAVDPETGSECIGLTRHHIVSAGRLSVIGMSPALVRLQRRWHARGAAMSLALVVGADPALILAAALGTWRVADYALAGSLAGAPIRLMHDEAVAVPMPAEAELVIAGEIAAGDIVSPGRLATPFGTYVAEDAVPVMQANLMLARSDPIFHALHVGVPGDLGGALCLAAEALVAEHIRTIEGGIDFLDIRCPPEAGAQVVVVKLRARVEGQAKTALMGALSGPANWLKLAIAVDEDVDAGDLRDVFWSVASRTHAEKDVGMIDGMRAHPFDAASPLAGNGTGRIGTRWLIDSTMPPLSQGKRREDFARAIPKNLDATDLMQFLPEG